MAEAHPELTGSVNCREITGVGLTTVVGRLRYFQRGEGKRCGRLHLKWAPEAQQIIDETISGFENSQSVEISGNCAVSTFRAVAENSGIGPHESVLVAGLAGGVGLLGNVCGALASGVYALSVSKYLSRGDTARDTQLRGAVQELTGAAFRGDPTRLRRAFVNRFGNDSCVGIVGRRFKDISDHSIFVGDGGCRDVIDFVSGWVGERLGENSW
jgi:hypothetical protein